MTLPVSRIVIIRKSPFAKLGSSFQPSGIIRFTHLSSTVCKVYCARGDIENRIKELKYGLEIDRTSCTSFKANQLRVLMTAAAYVLMQELRLQARHTGCACAQVNTLRLRLLKLGVWIESSVRRIACAVGAVPT